MVQFFHWKTRVLHLTNKLSIVSVFLIIESKRQHKSKQNQSLSQTTIKTNVTNVAKMLAQTKDNKAGAKKSKNGGDTLPFYNAVVFQNCR